MQLSSFYVGEEEGIRGCIELLKYCRACSITVCNVALEREIVLCDFANNKD